MADRDKPHLIIPNPAQAAAYRPPPRAVTARPLPVPQNRRQHGQGLRDDFVQAGVDAQRRRQERTVTVDGAIEGVYVTFDSFPGVELALERLEPQRGKTHPELRAVQEVSRGGDEPVERATVFVPQGRLNYFLDRFAQYLETAGNDKPRNRDLIDRIASIRAASIEALWTDPLEHFPSSDLPTWWEVWLRRRDGQELRRFRAFAAGFDLRIGPHSLGFGDRTVVLVRATVEQLAAAVDVLDDLAELRQPQAHPQFLAESDPVEQQQWVTDLAGRVQPADLDAPAVCVVDTGIYRDHPLLLASLDPADCHAAEPGWSVHDDQGHGTEMAGLALYGDFGAAITGQGPVRLRHRLESTKLLPPPPGENPPELWGAVTAQCTSRVEIQAPARRRVYSLAVTTPHPSSTNGQAPVLGQPSSWSATVDALAAGRSVITTDDGLVYLDEEEDAARRLFVVSAGNVRVWEDDYLTRSDLEPIENPAQAWNALTVGAYTELDTMIGAHPSFAGWTPLAPHGELSPFSRTSVAFNRSWPVKPDVVLEGGNVARSPDGSTFDTPGNLQMLTTQAPLTNSRLLATTHATSAATAQAAALAASIMAEYPNLWPETVRALIVHSAEWTPAMRQQFSTDGRKKARVALLRRYGIGVPHLGRATRSASDALTLIAQNVIHPFDHGKMREIHLHDLPWPVQILAELGAAQVRLRVTLSYFVEPNPGQRGWQRRYSYASHGLRFDVRRASESNADFQKRVNNLALAEDERRPQPSGDTGEWFFGPEQQRAPGSLHTDIWQGNAADLAQRGAVAVFPVTGWWKENPSRDRSNDGVRYALILSIETPNQDVDIWTAVAQQIGVTTDVTVRT